MSRLRVRNNLAEGTRLLRERRLTEKLEELFMHDVYNLGDAYRMLGDAEGSFSEYIPKDIQKWLIPKAVREECAKVLGESVKKLKHRGRSKI